MRQKLTALSLAILMAASAGSAVQASHANPDPEKNFDCKVLETMEEYARCMNDAP